LISQHEPAAVSEVVPKVAGLMITEPASPAVAAAAGCTIARDAAPIIVARATEILAKRMGCSSAVENAASKVLGRREATSG
jgi:hypothetical protein